MGALNDLTVYKKSFSLAMEIFELTKDFPKEERYSLIDQIRRSSRSTTVSIAEAYRKRQYEAHFKSKVSDADMENTETKVWLQFASACGYLGKESYQYCLEKAGEVGKLLNHMMHNPEKYKTKQQARQA